MTPPRSGAALRIAFVPFIAMLAVVFASMSLLPSISGVVAMIAMYSYVAAFFYLLPMLPTTQANVVVAKRSQRIGLTLLAIAVLLGIIAYGVVRAV